MPASVGFDTVRSRIFCPEARASSSASAESVRIKPPVCALGEHDFPSGAPGVLARSPDLELDLGQARSGAPSNPQKALFQKKIPTAREAAKFWYSNTDVGRLARRRFSPAPPTPDCHSAPEHCPASRDGSRAPSLPRTSSRNSVIASRRLCSRPLMSTISSRSLCARVASV